VEQNQLPKLQGQPGKDSYAQISEKKYYFQENCAIMMSMRGFAFKNRELGVFFPDQELPKTIFRLW
jgi:hypothetical protein